MNIEQRATPQPVKLQTRQSDNRSTLSGYAAVYYNAADPKTEYRLWDDMVERIMPGAFDRALRERQDIRCLFNHDTDNLLGRSVSGTLRLSSDPKGLAYDCDLPETSAGKDVGVMLARGDLDGSSFSFRPMKSTFREEVRDGKPHYIREIEDADVYDVGPVTFPAYEASTAGVRAENRQSVTAERDAWLKVRRSVNDEADAVEVAFRTMQMIEAECV